MGFNTKNGFVEYRHINPKGDYKTDLGGVTLRFEVDQKSERVRIGWALCSPEDTFCRDTGRHLAEESMNNGRLVEGQYMRCLNLVGNAGLHLMNHIAARNTSDDNRRDFKLVLERLNQIASYNEALDYF